MRMNRTVFELIRKNVRRERQIDDISYSGKEDMRALFNLVQSSVGPLMDANGN